MKAMNGSLLALLLIGTLIMTACGSGTTDEVGQEEDTTAIIADQATPMTEGTDDTGDVVDQAAMEEGESEEAETEEADSEEAESGQGEIDVSLLDKALLASVKFNWPESYSMLHTENSNEEEATIMTYQKGYSKREERTQEGITTITIYNEDLGITYEYIEGEAEGTMWRDTESDIEYLEEDKEMIGRSILSLLEEDLEEDIKIEAKRVRYLGRRALEIIISDMDPEAEESMGGWTMIIDEEYTVGLSTDMSFGEDWNYSMKVTDIDFNTRINDRQFLPPEDVNFIEY